MAENLITSLLSLATNLLSSITASAQAPSSSFSNSNNSQNGHARAVEENLERLMQTLKWIKATLYDAEEREIRDHSVKLWLKELKKVAYDAMDVLSEYRYEVTRIQVEARKGSEGFSSHKRKQMEDLKRLIVTLERIKGRLYDAEEREIIDRSIKLWLKELKKVVYDAENRYDVTRTIHVEARKAFEVSSSLKGKQMESIEYIVPSPYDMVDRLMKIRSRFDEIAKDRDAIQLRESDGVRRPNNNILRPLTGHMVDEASIFGRVTEIEEVIDFLLSEKR